jgi:hypothetical protein
MRGSNDPRNSSSSSSGDTEVRQEEGRTAWGGKGEKEGVEFSSKVNGGPLTSII